MDKSQFLALAKARVNFESLVNASAAAIDQKKRKPLEERVNAAVPSTSGRGASTASTVGVKRKAEEVRMKTV